MSGPSLSPLADPASLAKIQILLVPVHTSPGPSALSESTFEYWTSRIRQHHVLRGDELWRPQPTPTGHSRGIPGSDHPRTRFFPSGTGNSISRSASLNHIHLAYPAHPPARHLYPLSLLRMAAFPLVVIGVAVDSEHGNGDAKGYSLDEDDDSGDIGDVKTPTAPTFQHEEIHQTPHPRHDPASAFDNTLSNLLPETSPFPLVKRLIMVPRHTPQSPSPGPSPSSSNRGTPGRTSKVDDQHSASGDLVVSHAPSEGADAWIGGILGEVVGQVLGELGELAVALETPSGLRTLSSTLLPSLTSTLPGLPDRPSTSSRSSTPTSELPSRRHTGTPSSTLPQSHSVESLNGMGITLTRALTPGGRPTSVGPPSLPPIQTATVVSSSAPTPHSSSANPFRRSTAIHSPFSRTSSAASTSSNASATSASTQVGSIAKYTSAPLAGVAGGRLLKLLGDMYLMAGMYGDAIRCFDEGAEKCRVVGDVLWEALAREGRAVAGIGEAWEGMDGSDNAQPFPTSPIPVEILNHFLSSLACLSRAPLLFPQTILSPSPQAASGSMSFAPSSSKPAHLGTGEGLLAYLHTSLTLRIAHFQLLIWAAGGWGSVALSALMGHSLPRSFLPPLSEAESRDPVARRKHRRHTCMLSARSGLSRHSVFAHAELALSPHHRAMTKAEQLSVHVEAVWCARWLQLPRKEAHVTREVVKRVGSMIVEGREETRRAGVNGFTRSKSSMPTKDAVSASIGLGIGMTVPAVPAVGIRRRESAEGNLAVISLFERSAAILGIDLLTFSTSPLPHVEKYMDKAPASTDLNRFGWPELQVETMKEGIAIAEALPDHASVVRLCTSALKNLYGYLSPQSQGHLARMFPQALGVMRRRGMEFGGMMWWLPGRVVLSIEVACLAPNRLPLEHTRSEIVKEGVKDPFLYNPRLKTAEAGKTIIVANEQVDVFVTLQNPFAFDLELSNLSLLTSGATFISSPLPMTIPASSVQTVRVAGVASSPGVLTMRGVSLRLTDGSATDILLPVINEKDREKRDKRKSRAGIDGGKVKHFGIDARFAEHEASIHEQVEDKYLECEVVVEQPLVWIKKTNMTHGTVMLYNGESSTIRLTLENTSSVPVDFIKLSFDDSSARDAQSLISEGDLSPEQAYELEWDVLNRPVFVWENEQDTAIAPGGKLSLSIRCLGKVGCTDGSIRIDYGYISRSDPTSTSNAFYTRQITFPVLFTVYHTLEPHALDLTRLVAPSKSSTDFNGLQVPNGHSRPSTPTPSRRQTGFAAIEDDPLRSMLVDKADGSEWCLLGLGVRNVYGVPFEIRLGRKKGARAEDEDAAGWDPEVRRLVPPGASERILFPVPRCALPEQVISRRIPSLTDRQYIVDKSKKSAEVVARERELFWYREELLNMLEATWIEPGSKRSGQLSLRDQIFSPALLDVFKIDDVDISLDIAGKQGNKSIESNDFVDLCIKVTNRSERPFRPLIHIEPLPSSSTDSSWASASTNPTPVPPRRPPSSIQAQNPPHRNILFDGTLTNLFPLLQPGQTGQHQVGVVFLASGTYAIRAAAEEVRLDNNRAKTADGDVPNLRFSPLLRVKVV